MNTIQALELSGTFCSEPHLTILVDGVPIDQSLDSMLPEAELLGLMPCLLPGLADPHAAAIALARFVPPSGVCLNSPILVCPDDLDFSCTTVIAEICNTGEVIEWPRIGINRSEPMELPHGVGSKVDWIPGFDGWSFNLRQYQTVHDTFRNLHIRIGRDPN